MRGQNSCPLKQSSELFALPDHLCASSTTDNGLWQSSVLDLFSQRPRRDAQHLHYGLGIQVVALRCRAVNLLGNYLSDSAGNILNQLLLRYAC